LKKRRVRQHVNPLSITHLTPISLPNWSEIYLREIQPLHLDLGCAKGRFILKMAQLYPEINFLGIEIRESLVKEAILVRDSLGLTNLHYLSGNINYVPNILLSSLPKGRLKWITVQFPDPWFKHKHLKRRMLQPKLVESLVEYLIPGGVFFIQSDIQEVAIEMKRYLQQNPALKLTSDHWIENNPFPVPTEREIGVLNKGEPIYRAYFLRHL
jgi:tRNA (guanine-N7-)-methyltransferase